MLTWWVALSTVVGVHYFILQFIAKRLSLSSFRLRNVRPHFVSPFLDVPSHFIAGLKVKKEKESQPVTDGMFS